VKQVFHRLLAKPPTFLKNLLTNFPNHIILMIPCEAGTSNVETGGTEMKKQVSPAVAVIVIVVVVVILAAIWYLTLGRPKSSAPPPPAEPAKGGDIGTGGALPGEAAGAAGTPTGEPTKGGDFPGR
jgi:hypothetical protein